MLRPAGVIWTPEPGVWSCWSMIIKELLRSVAHWGPASVPTPGMTKFMLGEIVLGIRIPLYPRPQPLNC